MEDPYGLQSMIIPDQNADLLDYECVIGIIPDSVLVLFFVNERERKIPEKIGVLDNDNNLCGYVTREQVDRIIQQAYSRPKYVLPLNGNPLSTASFFRCPDNHVIIRVNDYNYDRPPRCPKCHQKLLKVYE